MLRPLFYHGGISGPGARLDLGEGAADAFQTLAQTAQQLVVEGVVSFDEMERAVGR